MREQPFQRKTWGRIFVTQRDHISLVEKIIEELDPFEAGYMPEHLVSVLNSDVSMVYLHKFEIDKNALTLKCWQQGIWIWCVDNQPEFGL